MKRIILSLIGVVVFIVSYCQGLPTTTTTSRYNYNLFWIELICSVYLFLIRHPFIIGQGRTTTPISWRIVLSLQIGSRLQMVYFVSEMKQLNYFPKRPRSHVSMHWLIWVTTTVSTFDIQLGTNIRVPSMILFFLFIPLIDPRVFYWMFWWNFIFILQFKSCNLSRKSWKHWCPASVHPLIIGR